MKTATIYRKTIAYVWLKFALCAVSAIIAVLLFLLLVTGLSAIGEGPGAAGFIFWLILVPLIYPLVKYFFGHRIIAGHLNAITEAITTEHLPLDLLKTIDKETVELFPSFAHYKERELEVSNSVKQLYQRISDSVDLFEGVSSKEWFKRFVIKATYMYLAYISSACIAQIFKKPSQMQEKTVAHSIGVFFRNWQKFLIDTYKVTSRMVITIASIAVVLIALSVTLTVLVAKANIMTVALGVVLGAIFTDGIKNSFIDPVQIIRTTKIFAAVEAEDKDDPDSYAKMAILSPAYTKLWKKSGGAEITETAIIKNESEN